MSEDSKTPPEGLRAVCISTANAVIVLEQNDVTQDRRLARLERVAMPRVVHTFAALMIGIAVGVPFGAWLALLTRFR